MSPRAWREPLPLKTYPLGPPDPNPPFQRQNHTWACYPYPLLDDVLEGEPTVRDWNALHLENEYLHCIVLPELGGHLYSLLDKVTGREVFYRNNVVKYGLIAIRGAWISGGIEFNFPTGHTYTTVSPVSWELGEDEGGAWLAVGNICRVSRMEWWVKLTLEPGRRRLKEEVWLHNPMPYRQRHWFWNNSAVPARDDLRLVYPARKARLAGGIVDYPVHDGVDWSRYVNHTHADDIFTLDVEEDFFGCHYDQLDFGMVHVADRAKLKGKKFFTWGTADDGMRWVDLLTDDDGQYVEIQSGLFETQSEWGWLQPFETKNWEEYWLPEHGMDGWVWANEEAALNFDVRGAFVQVGATTTAKREGAQLALLSDGETVWSQGLDLDPAVPFVFQVPLPLEPGWKGELVLTQRDAEILRYVHPPRHTTQPKVAETGENVVPKPKPEEECTAEELCERADQAMLRLEHREARRVYELALGQDSDCAATHVRFGQLELRSGQYESAASHFEAALKAAPSSASIGYTALYCLGVARCLAGDGRTAEDALRQARDMEGGRIGPATKLLTWLNLTEGIEDAGYTGLPPAAHTVEFGPWRRALLGQAEGTVPWEATAHLVHWTRSDPQMWVEFALQRDDAALPSRPVSTLEACVQRWLPCRPDPMLYCTLAYWQNRLGRQDQAGQALLRAQQCPPYLCFPSRLEELPILEWAVEKDPSDWKAMLYLGNLLASFDRYDEAMAQWRAAVEIDGSYAVLHRNLGFGALHWEENAKAAAEHYRRAIERNPDDHRYYLDLVGIFAKHLDKTPAQRLTLLRSAPEAVQQKWQVAAHVAELLVETGEHDEALAMLRAHRFFPWEGARDMRRIWVRCRTERGAAASACGDHAQALADLEAAMQYPRNLGVGKPAHPQDAWIYWLAALEAKALGLDEKRQRYLTVAAEEPHRGPCDADTYKARALRELGRDDEAAALEQQIRDRAAAAAPGKE